jgi:DNA topoisomerase VI subunit B
MAPNSRTSVSHFVCDNTMNLPPLDRQRLVDGGGHLHRLGARADGDRSTSAHLRRGSAMSTSRTSQITGYPISDGMPSGENVPARNSPIFQVRRPDTLQFASIEGLCRMAGVARNQLRRLIAKEAVDNALDECDRVGRPGAVTISRDGNHYVVDDQGDGIPGDAATLADLFSANRPMVSAKFLRLPRRGLLGNGLRCLAAGVALSGETIIVEAHGHLTMLRPRRAGPTEVVEVSESEHRSGTRITYTLGDVIPDDGFDLTDAQDAINLAMDAGSAFTRRPSPHWLDLDHLVETFETIEPVDTTIRQLIAQLDGCTGSMAGKLAAPFGKGRTCRSMRQDEVAQLLQAMQAAAREVKPRALGLLGPDAFSETVDGYIVAETALSVGRREPYGRIPVLIEAWAVVTTRSGGDATLDVYCNRSPAVGGAYAIRTHGSRILLGGAGMIQDGPAINVEGGDCQLMVAITAPLIPTTSLGKAADLSLLQEDIAEALRRAFNRSRNRLPPDPKQPKPPGTCLYPSSCGLRRIGHPVRWQRDWPRKLKLPA